MEQNLLESNQSQSELFEKSIDNDSCYLIDLVASNFFDEKLTTSLTLRSKGVSELWIKLVVAAADCGTVVRGRQILPASFIVDGDFFEGLATQLDVIVKHSLIKIKKVRPRKTTEAKENNKFSRHTKDTFIGGDLEQAENFKVDDWFNKFWELYPTRDGVKLNKASAKKWFIDNVKSLDTAEQVMSATEKYSTSSSVVNGFAKDAVNFLPNYLDWLTFSNAGKRTLSQREINRANGDKVIL